MKKKVAIYASFDDWVAGILTKKEIRGKDNKDDGNERHDHRKKNRQKQSHR